MKEIRGIPILKEKKLPVCMVVGIGRRALRRNSVLWYTPTSEGVLPRAKSYGTHPVDRRNTEDVYRTTSHDA